MAQYKGSVCDESRAKQLIKKREQELQELEQKRKKIESNLHVYDLTNKFSVSPAIIVEKSYVKSRVGLLTLNELRENQKSQSSKEENSEEYKLKTQLRILRDENERKKRKQFNEIKKLSFINEDSDVDDYDDDYDDYEYDDNSDKKNDNLKKEFDEKIMTTTLNNQNEEALICVTRKRLKKNPNVDTSFLPDRFRDEMEQKIREELRNEWLEKQEKLKDESILVMFSYWDGSGHRRECVVKKGYTIYQFLQKALDILRRDFHELKNAMSDQLMFVKEDLILPHHYTFYDFIVSKSRGKSGPLFHFDIHDDIRLCNDATIEKDESHASKILLRSWYERHKHIFPANRWEPFDPTKTYSKYTISDRKNKN